MRVTSWVFEAPGKPMVPLERDAAPGPDEVLVKVKGCGVCHTDLGFFYEGVPTRHALPLCLGHEVSGTIVQAGADHEAWVGRHVIVPAVIPCGTCPACQAGRVSICPHQVFPGNDVHGGFGTHLTVPGRGLCPVPDLSDNRVNPKGTELASLSVIADAVSTPYQAILRSGLAEGDLAVFVGVGGVGGFGAQIAKALGATVIAVDVDDERLATLSRHGAFTTLGSDVIEAKAVKKRVRDIANEQEIPTWRWRIFETSGTPSGQATAFSLLSPGSYLGVVGYTPKKIELRLSNLMAFDATAQGNWGCAPEHYPKVLELVLSGRVAVEPFITKRPLAAINETFEALHSHELKARPVLVPED